MWWHVTCECAELFHSFQMNNSLIHLTNEKVDLMERVEHGSYVLLLKLYIDRTGEWKHPEREAAHVETAAAMIHAADASNDPDEPHEYGGFIIACQTNAAPLSALCAFSMKPGKRRNQWLTCVHMKPRARSSSALVIKRHPEILCW